MHENHDELDVVCPFFSYELVRYKHTRTNEILKKVLLISKSRRQSRGPFQ